MAVDVFSYVRTRDGFLTAIHDTVAHAGETYRVPTFNPGSNPNQVSVLRLVNAGPTDAEARIRAVDDEGESPGVPVRVSVPARAVREYTAAELETGGDGLEGAIGDGVGKWRLDVESEHPLSVASVLRSPTGHITNLSTIPPKTRTETGEVPRIDAVHNDNVVVLRVGEDITDGHSLRLEDYMRVFYNEFEDAFDFLMFFSNASDFLPGRPSINYYRRMRNDVEGIGRPVSDFALKSLLPSLSRLRGVVYLNNNEPKAGFHSLANGPSLHEIMHAWANSVVSTTQPGHWGLSSANGQLGGFDPETLEDLGGGRYAANFPPGGTRRPYSAIELYLAGYVGPEEVPDLSVAEDVEWVREGGRIAETADGKQIFTAGGWRTFTIDDIVEAHGPRVPAAGAAQWHFRTAVILLTDIGHPGTPEELDLLSGHAERFSLRGSDDLDGYNNYFEATRGLGSMTMDGLSAFRRARAETSTAGLEQGAAIGRGSTAPWREVGSGLGRDRVE